MSDLTDTELEALFAAARAWQPEKGECPAPETWVAWAEGDRPKGKDLARARRHLAACADCRELFREICDLVEEAPEASAAGAPPDPNALKRARNVYNDWVGRKKAAARPPEKRPAAAPSLPPIRIPGFPEAEAAPAMQRAAASLGGDEPRDGRRDRAEAFRGMAAALGEEARVLHEADRQPAGRLLRAAEVASAILRDAAREYAEAVEAGEILPAAATAEPLAGAMDLLRSLSERLRAVGSAPLRAIPELLGPAPAELDAALRVMAEVRRCLEET